MWEPTAEQIKEIKLINGEQGTAKDEYYRAMLPIIFDEVKEYCNNTFGETGSESLALPGGVKLFMAKAIQFNEKKAGLKSKSMGSVSYSYENDFPESLYKYLGPYRKVRFHVQR